MVESDISDQENSDVFDDCSESESDHKPRKSTKTPPPR